MKKAIVYLLTLLGINIGCTAPRTDEVEADVFATFVGDSRYVIVDVRHADEYAAGHIAGAINIDVGDSDFVEQCQRVISREHIVALYCLRGHRSLRASRRLQEAGYTTRSLRGGIKAWHRPVETSHRGVSKL